MNRFITVITNCVYIKIFSNYLQHYTVTLVITPMLCYVSFLSMSMALHELEVSLFSLPTRKMNIETFYLKQTFSHPKMLIVTFCHVTFCPRVFVSYKNDFILFDLLPYDSLSVSALRSPRVQPSQHVLRYMILGEGWHACSFCRCWLNCLPSIFKLSFHFYRYPNEVYSIII